MRLFTFFAVGMLLIVGCSGKAAYTSYDSDSKKTTYRTRDYTVSTLSGSNIGSSKSISMRAVGKCVGQGCTPNTIQFVFSASGNQSLKFAELSGEIVADDTQIEWTSSEAAVEYQAASTREVIDVIGKFAVVDLSVSQLNQIASASSVEGNIGERPLDIGSGVQEGLRSLLQKIEGPAGSPGNTSEG